MSHLPQYPRKGARQSEAYRGRTPARRQTNPVTSHKQPAFLNRPISCSPAGKKAIREKRLLILPKGTQVILASLFQSSFLYRRKKKQNLKICHSERQFSSVPRIEKGIFVLSKMTESIFSPVRLQWLP